MLQLMEYAIKNGDADNEVDWYRKIKYNYRNVSSLKSGVTSFRINHIAAACKLSNITSDWVLGLSNKMINIEQSNSITDKKTALNIIKKCIRVLEK